MLVGFLKSKRRLRNVWLRDKNIITYFLGVSHRIHIRPSITLFNSFSTNNAKVFYPNRWTNISYIFHLLAMLSEQIYTTFFFQSWRLYCVNKCDMTWFIRKNIFGTFYLSFDYISFVMSEKVHYFVDLICFFNIPAQMCARDFVKSDLPEMLRYFAFY